MDPGEAGRPAQGALKPSLDRHLVFISYSHTEAKWCQWITDMLDPYVRDGHLRIWADPYIPVGATWRREIENALKHTRVAVLLVSADFEGSAFIYEQELPALLAAADAGQAVIVAIPVSASTASLGSGVGLFAKLTERQWARSPRVPLDRLRPPHRRGELVRIAKIIAETFGQLGPVGEVRVTPRATLPVQPLANRGLAALHDVPSLPSDLVDRPGSHERIKEAVLAHGTVGLTGRLISVGVQGLAGVGKTVLAQAVAHDDEIRRAFPDGVYWVTVGQRADLWSLQVDLLRRLDATATAATLVEARSLLLERLEDRRILLVLDDVWDVGQALAFDVLPAQSRLLITTRESTVIRALGAAEYALDVFDRHESLAFLARRSGVAVLPPEAELVADACGDLPLALAIAAGAVREGRAWVDVHRHLEDARVTYSEHPFRRVFQALEASVDWLSREETARYLELAVFPDDEPVPEAVVERYWAYTARLDADGTATLLARLSDKHLLALTEAPSARHVSLHDLQLQFLRLQADQPESLHRALLNAHRPAAIGRRAASEWSELPEHETYLWRHLAYHLRHAGATNELRGLLVDPAWIEAKLRAVGIAGLLADYVPFSADPVVSTLADTLRLASHVLIANPSEMRSQLWGRLGLQQPEELRQTLNKCLESASPWLRPVAPTLTSPRGSLRAILKGHTAGVLAVALTSDGTRAVSAAGDATLRVWDLASGRALHILEGHTAEVRAVAVTPDGTRAVSAADDATLRVWDLATGRALHTLDGHTAGVLAVAVTADGACAVSAAVDMTLRVWDLTTGRVLHILEGHTAWVRAVAVTPDGTRAVSAADDSTLRVWDLVSGRRLHTLEGHTRLVNAVAVTPDGTRAVSAADDGTLRVWDLASGKAVHILEGHTAGVIAVAVTSDGTRAVSAAVDATLRVWDLASGRVLHTLEGHDVSIMAIAVTSDGTRAVSAAFDATMRVWDLASGRALHTLEGHALCIMAVAVTPEGSRAVSAAFDATLRVWDLASGHALDSLEGHTHLVNAVAVTPDGTRAASAADDVTLRVWDLASGRTLHILEGHTRLVNAVAVTPDGTRAVSAAADATLRVWDLASGRVLHTLEGHTAGVLAVALTSDGTHAVSAAGDATLRVWDLGTGRVLHTLVGHTAGVLAVTVTAGGMRAVSAADDATLRVWDLSNGRALHTLQGHTAGVRAVAVTSDGTRAVSGADDSTLRVWDVASGRALHTLEGHTAGVRALTVTPDGTRAVSAAGDATLRVWDLASGRTLHTLEGHVAGVLAVAVTPDGMRAVSAAADATLRVWDLVTGGCVTSFTGDGSMNCCTIAGQHCVVAGAADGRVHILWLEEADR